MGRPERVTREEVLRAAREAFAERGFDGTTLAAIGLRLRVSPAALLRHAPTKEALFAAAMEAGQSETNLPSAFLAGCDGSENPFPLLRRFAEALVPFIDGRIGETIAAWMRMRTVSGVPVLKFPFDPRRRSSPPQRILVDLEAYFRRAKKAGTLRVRDPRAAAVAWLGTLQAYVFMHRVAQIAPPVPLGEYLDTVLDVWKRGALSSGRRRR